MRTEGFIASRLRFKGKLAVAASAISFFIIIISVAISSGFSTEIRKSVAELSGDILVSNSYNDIYSDSNPIRDADSLCAEISRMPGVLSAVPTAYRAGIIRQDRDMDGILFKGTTSDTVSMGARVPEKLSRRLGLREGDEILCYFVADKVRLRKFTISEIYSSALGNDDAAILYIPLSDMQRLNGWSRDEASAIEVYTERSVNESASKTEDLCARIGLNTELATISARAKYARLFDWMELIEYNVWAIIALMVVVAGFNMISAQLILLFRNISTIGTLKALGMKNRSIAEIFLRVSARLTGKGMLIGNGLALLFCIIQGTTRLIKLNPENYFVSFVPVNLDWLFIITANLGAFFLILLFQLIPTLFISKIDPSVTVKSE